MKKNNTVIPPFLRTIGVLFLGTLLVLVLAAEVYGGPHAGGKLTHAGHVPVYLHATAAVRGDAAAYHAAVGVSPAHEEAALDAEPVRTLPDGRRVRALPH